MLRYKGLELENVTGCYPKDARQQSRSPLKTSLFLKPPRWCETHTHSKTWSRLQPAMPHRFMAVFAAPASLTLHWEGGGEKQRGRQPCLRTWLCTYIITLKQAAQPHRDRQTDTQEGDAHPHYPTFTQTVISQFRVSILVISHRPCLHTVAAAVAAAAVERLMYEHLF